MPAYYLIAIAAFVGVTAWSAESPCSCARTGPRKIEDRLDLLTSGMGPRRKPRSSKPACWRSRWTACRVSWRT